MDYEDDPIVEEIPVYLSKNLLDILYLFQYPTKTDLPNTDEAVVVSCSVKPYTQEVKVNFGLNVESMYFDRFKAKKFADAADGEVSSNPQARGADRPTYKRGIMDRQAFVSSRSLTDISKYIVGIYTDKEMHVSPLTSIVQLRPSLAHFDKEDKRRKAEMKTQNEEFDEDEVLQQVTVKFARSGAGAKKAREQRTYDNFVKRIVDEPWCETFWHARNTARAQVERQKLYATSHLLNQSLSMQPDQYLTMLLPHDEHMQQSNPISAKPINNKAMLKSMSLLEQLRILLVDAKMLSFNDIINVLTKHVDPHVSADKVLALVPQVGILLHGNWVAKSEYVYPENLLTNSNGVSAAQMQRARDYILYKFSRTQYLYRSQIMAATQLPPIETLEMMCSVARVNNSKRWELLLPPDKEFEQKNAELVQRQEMHWRASEQMYTEMDWARENKRVRKRSTRKSESQSLQQQPSSMLPPSTVSTLEATKSAT